MAAQGLHKIHDIRTAATVHCRARETEPVEEWKFSQENPAECLAKLHFFSIKKKHKAGEIEARITVREFATARTTDMKYYACADVELNQKTLPFQPCGWGESLQCALTECLRNLRKFEYEPQDETAGTLAD